MNSPPVQQTSLYNGVSNRTRGWKTRLANPTVMRWDGASRSSEVWDSLRRDPELWFRDGDCDVHLHSEGQSRRGPAFRVSYSALLEANCQPLIDNFVSRTQLRTNDVNGCDDTSTASCLEGSTRDRIELYIPAPAESDKRRSYDYHLATRNLFAFIFRRPIVGEYLGSTLINLCDSLHQFRTPGADNVQDLMGYIDEKGYLNLGGQPTNALAMLHLAETFQLRDLYIDAFAHCCGMGNQIFIGPEYQLLSSVTRKSIRRTRFEMLSRLERASTMLRTLLYDGMCELDIDLHAGVQEHLQRFRALLQEVYAARVSRHPTQSVDHNPQATILEVDVFRTMRNDFEALYEFLVDESYDHSRTRKVTESGISILRSIELFDVRYSCTPLLRPLPLLPNIPRGKSSSWGVSWLNKPSKMSRSRRANTSPALSKATNSRRPDLMENHLVCAYQKFEGDQISETKAGRPEKIGPLEGRKIRWILIYAIYQTLRQVTEIAAEIRNVTGAAYHLCISTAGLPPWEESHAVHTLEHSQLDPVSPPSVHPSSFELEAKSNNEVPAPADQAIRRTRKLQKGTKPGTPNFKDNFAGIVTRKSTTLRRSLSLFIKHETARPDPQAKNAPHHEISVRGYDNGMTIGADDKELAIETTPTDLVNPFNNMPISTPASEISNSSETYGNSETGTLGTSDTFMASTPVQSSVDGRDRERASVYKRCGLHDINRDSASKSLGRPRSLFSGDCRYHSTIRNTQFDDESRSTPPRGRPMSVREDPDRRLEPATASIHDAKTECTSDPNIRMPSPQAPTAWDYIQAVMEVQASHYDLNVDAEWDQFTHLGNVIETRSETLAPTTNPTSRRALTMF
ncbi:hypothetical protein F5Y10DRAFT_271963 [Nemania abortiva]|nr:hypothetical protein F5Y10DRAFT_271963 [Nemania abortiva]